MEQWLLPLNNFSSNVLIFFMVITIKMVVAHFGWRAPSSFFSWYCQQLAKKVNKPENSINQRKIAGIIAALITLFPIITMLWLFGDFIAVIWLWHSILLYLALGNFQLNRTIKKTIQALQTKQTHLAKQTLKPMLLRNVEQLSSMGLSKATIEMQLLRYLQQYVIIAFYYLTLGALTAFSVRLILEMHYCWNQKKATFVHFGQFISILSAIVQWIPIRIFAFIMLLSAIGNHFSEAINRYKKYYFQLNNNIVIALLAQILHIKLAGVAMYDGCKLRRVNFNNSAPQPQIIDIIRANKYSIHLLYFILALTMILAVTTLLIH